jgi:hypothetical protein
MAAALVTPKLSAITHPKASERHLRGKKRAGQTFDSLELANAVRAAGAYAEMKVRSPYGTWRAGVMASGSDGFWRTALEAQLSHITPADITARAERMRADGVPSIWFSDKRRPPWLGTVPSVRLAHPDDGDGLVVAQGHPRPRPRRRTSPGARSRVVSIPSQRA